MNTRNRSARASEALVRAASHHGAAALMHSGESQSDKRRPFSIAISREAGTRGPAIAKALADRLGWPMYDHELLELVARDLKVRVKLLENVDEHHVTWLQECVEAFAAVPAVREGKYVRHLIETMLSLAARGNCVIVGRGSPFVLPPATTLRVRLMAPLDDRVAAVCREQNVPWVEAAQWVEQVDRERAQFVRLHFLRDADDPRYYDLLLNTAQFSLTDCAE